MPAETPDLIARIKQLHQDPALRTEYADGSTSEVYRPVSPDAIAAVEAELGFPLPPLLVRCYTEVGNGGFGPGHGLIGMEAGDGDGFRHDLTDSFLADLYAGYREEPLEGPWPKGLLPLFLKGDGAMDCVQATKPPYLVTVLRDDGTLHRTKQTLEAYLLGWVETMEGRLRK